MFQFRSFQCNFITSKDLYGNLSVSVHTTDGLLLYQLTEELPYPIPDGMVVFKEAPFVFQFLAQMQKEGLLVGGLERRTIHSNGCLLGKIKRTMPKESVRSSAGSL